jgi:hypothetical protein
MTPKEKAKQLVDEYLVYVEAHSSTFQLENAKTCAIITVDEIINALAEYDGRNNTYELQNMDRDFNYWHEVKKEIEYYDTKR